ncbi:MAG: hypothetical protein ACRC8A_09495 [Microcoleaceae cyanobacterium]
MPIETVPGSDLKYFLVAFDPKGNERLDDPDGKMSNLIVEALQQPSITDVFIFSHGWLSDVPAARLQYGAWIETMVNQAADLERMRQIRPGFSPCLVGIHWPSEPWGEYELTRSAIAAAPYFDTPVDAGIDYLVNQYAERISETPAARQALQTVFEAAVEDISPEQLPAEVGDAYRILDREASLGSEGLGAKPSADREPFDPDSTFLVARQEALSYAGFSWGGVLAPLRTLSFWKMKDRARQIGETGGFRLLTQLQQAARPAVQFHLMGHSFGCIVMSGMLNGKASQGQLVRPLHSLALIQGALSHWSYCPDIPLAPGTPGYFHRIFSQGKISGPAITTQSRFDIALNKWYPLAANAASLFAKSISFYSNSDPLPEYGSVGAFGAQGGVGFNAVELKMNPREIAYEFQPGVIYNLDGSEFIREGNRAEGAHNDITRPEVAHAVWEIAY